MADRSDVSTATIKYYVREVLPPAGEHVGQKRTEYCEKHLHRLRLVRVMPEIGELPLEAVSQVLAALDTPDEPLTYTAEVAQAAPVLHTLTGLEHSRR